MNATNSASATAGKLSVQTRFEGSAFARASLQERSHPEIRDHGQDADRGEQRSPAVSRAQESDGSPGEADDQIVARPQDSEIGQGHPAVLPVFLVRPDHHEPGGPQATRLRKTSRVAASRTRFYVKL